MGILTVIEMILMFILVPLILGMAFSVVTKEYCSIDISSAVFWYLSGTFIMWAIYELISVPFIFAKKPFMTTVYVWLAVTGLVLAAAIVVIAKKLISINKDKADMVKADKAKADKAKADKVKADKAKADKVKADKAKAVNDKENNKKNIVLFCIALTVTLMIAGFQCQRYVSFMFIDDDDSRFVVNAVEAYENDTMLTANPATGIEHETWVRELSKDVVSPWMLYVALIAKIFSIHPTIVAHTILPPVLLIMSYMAYWLLGASIFQNRKTHSMLFVMVISIINLYFSDTTHTQSYVTLVRLWQGKAIVAAVMIPVLLCFMMRLYREQKQNGMYAVIFVTALATCLLSGIGIFFSGIMIGTFGLYNCIVTKKYKEIVGVIIACIPTLIYGVIYYLLG